MSLDVVLVYEGLERPGGVAVDVDNLAAGLRAAHHRVATVRSARELSRALDDARPAIVHIFGCTPSLATLASMVYARARRRTHLVWTPVFHPSRRHSWHGYGVLRVMQLFDYVAPYAARVADAIVAATPVEAEFFRRIGSRRVEQIPPGTSLPDAAVQDAALESVRRSLGLTEAPVVLVIARQSSRKGLPFALETVGHVASIMPAVQLLLVGADLRVPVTGRARGVCPGGLSSDEIGRAYALADLLF